MNPSFPYAQVDFITYKKAEYNKMYNFILKKKSKCYLQLIIILLFVLEDSTNAYLNANWRPVAESLNPILAKTIEDIMLDILQKVFDNIPADFFLGDIDENDKRKAKQK